MADQDQIHVGGTPLFILTVEEDGAAVPLGVYETFVVRFRKPNGKSLDRVGTLTTPPDADDGKVEYKAVTTDLDQSGGWKVQAFASGGVDNFPTSWGSFRVHPNIPDP